jgi:hypothetical protein
VAASDLDLLLDNLETIERTDTEGILSMTGADFDGLNTAGGGLLTTWHGEPGHHVEFLQIGDVNHDGMQNGLDVDPFVDVASPDTGTRCTRSSPRWDTCERCRRRGGKPPSEIWKQISPHPRGHWLGSAADTSFSVPSQFHSRSTRHSQRRNRKSRRSSCSARRLQLHGRPINREMRGGVMPARARILWRSSPAPTVWLAQIRTNSRDSITDRYPQRTQTQCRPFSLLRYSKTHRLISFSPAR